MIVIETCPCCGSDLYNLMLLSNPPTPKKECRTCGWSWTGKPEEVVRVPFGGNTIDTSYSLNHYLSSNLSEDDCTSSFSQSACLNCANNPDNGGSGICLCTLGHTEITC